MTLEELKDMAAGVILAHAEDIEYMSIGEMLEDDLAELSDDEYDAAMSAIDALIGKAKVTVTWDE